MKNLKNKIVDFNEDWGILNEFRPDQLSDVLPDVQPELMGSASFLVLSKCVNVFKRKRK